MKIFLKTLPALAALITFSGIATAQDGERRGGRDRELNEREKEFDKDGDGRLSREERQAQTAAREKETLTKYDADKDGKLSAEERGKWRAEVETMMASRRGPGGPGRGEGGGGRGGEGRGRGGFGGFQVVPSEEAIAKFDKDGNGMLNGEEVRTYAAEQRKENLAKYDTDKNGELSREEMGKMREDRRKELEAAKEAKPDAPKPEEKKD